MKIKRTFAVFALVAALLLQSTAYAAAGDHGVDWSRYHGGGIYGQTTYETLRQSLKASVHILIFGIRSAEMLALVSKS